MITDDCPECGKTYTWDSDTDSYFESDEVTKKIKDRSVTLHLCNCHGVIGVSVQDLRFGCTLYTPSTKEL